MSSLTSFAMGYLTFTHCSQFYIAKNTISVSGEEESLNRNILFSHSVNKPCSILLDTTDNYKSYYHQVLGHPAICDLSDKQDITNFLHSAHQLGTQK